MRVFVAGATGAIGRPLVRQLIEGGHDVSAITRSSARAASLRGQGVDAHVGDALDASQVSELFRKIRPEVVMHQLTTFPTTLRPARTLRDWRQTVRLRVEGARLFTELARETGARRVVAQSIAFGYRPLPEEIKVVESDPFYGRGRSPMDLVMRHLLRLEEIVTSADGVEGVALRYGGWYGPGTFFAPGDSFHRLGMKRRLVMVRGSQGCWNAIHVEDAASATVAAMSGPEGVFNIVDDEPKRWNDFVSSYCDRIGAPQPRVVPRGTLALTGFYLRHLVLHQMPASNEKAKRDLEWKPRYASLDDGVGAVEGASELHDGCKGSSASRP